jgi:Tetracyclin repressor-like, C-terminal domain
VAVVAGHVRTIAQQSSGVEHPEEAMSAGLAAQVRAHRDRFPALTAALSSVAEHGGQDDALDFGLERILDGIGLLVARCATAGPATS